MKNLLRYLYKTLKHCWINSSNERKISYLKKKGGEIGGGTRLICNIDSFGSEPYLVRIGKNCLFSEGVHFLTHDGGVKVLNTLGYFDNPNDKMGRVSIGDNCYVGLGSVIMPNVTIGDNVIVGVYSVVTHDVPSGNVVAGIPAKVICTIDEYYQKNKNLGRFFDFKKIGIQSKEYFTTRN